MMPRTLWKGSYGHDGTSAGASDNSRRSGRAGWSGATTILTFVALLDLVELIDQLTGGKLDNNGIRPLKTDGLWGSSSRPFCTPTGRI